MLEELFLRLLDTPAMLEENADLELGLLSPSPLAPLTGAGVKGVYRHIRFLLLFLLF